MQFKYQLCALLLLIGCEKKEIALCEEEDICEVSVYPNPTAGPITISLKSDVEIPSQFEIYNIHGSVVAAKQVNIKKKENKISFDISALKPGIYILHLVDEDSTIKINKKIIKNQ